jgi:ribosomal protein L11 methyltransferase
MVAAGSPLPAAGDCTGVWCLILLQARDCLQLRQTGNYVSSVDALHPNRPSSSSVVLDTPANFHASLTVVSAEVPRETVEALIETLADAGCCASSWDDVESANSRLSIFLQAAADAPLARQALVDAGRALALDLQPAVATLPEQDWAESWKRFFRVQRVSERIVIRPTWEPYEPQPGDCVVDLDPGMSFGTGNHGTTQACLVFLDQLAVVDTDRSVLDMGCGSGILAIAARKLGFAEVAAFDNDPDAVAIARENAADNGVGVVFEVCDLAQNTRQADIVVANILAPVLIAHAGVLAAAVQGACAPQGPQELAPPGDRVRNGGRSSATPAEQDRGVLILSGILDTQYAAVRAAFEAQGFAEARSLPIGEWRSGLFTRRAP